MDNNETILVTGGSGFIGTAVCMLLVEQGYNVVNIDREKKDIPGVTQYPFDLSSSQTDGIFSLAKPHTIIHLAADHEIGRSVIDPSIFYQNNVINTIRILNLAVLMGVKNFIFSSTSSVYGDTEEYPTTEDHMVNPINPYAKSKSIIEQLLPDYERAYGLKYVSLRYFNAVGAMPDMSHGYTQTPASHLVPIACHNIANHKSTTINGDDYPTKDGTAARDYTHVVDIANAHIRAIDYLNSGANSNIFNIGAGESTTVLEILDLIEQVSHEIALYEIGPPRAGDAAITHADISKAKNILGWEPKYSVKESIEHAWLWEVR
jgi:UDP-glucose 4-epimerase